MDFDPQKESYRRKVSQMIANPLLEYMDLDFQMEVNKENHWRVNHMVSQKESAEAVMGNKDIQMEY
jgi:hypothetical protein